MQSKGAPETSLITELRELDLDIVDWGGSDLGAGTGLFYDRVRAAVGEGEADRRVWHRNQPALNIAAANAATKPLAESWVWDLRKSPVDVAPLKAVTGASWCLTSAMPQKTSPSAYEERGLEVV
jgi:hypothetical protein